MTLPESSFRYGTAVLAATLLLVGCRQGEVRTYRTAKEPSDLFIVPRAAKPADVQAVEPAAAEWQVPANWSPQKATGMRLASFAFTDPTGAVADISVITFGGSGGDELANINRWRGQLSLAPIGAGDLPTQVEALSAQAGDFSVTDLVAEKAEQGKPLSRILGAWLRRGGKVWFFKAMGPKDVVGSQKDAFLTFLKSVRFAEAAAPESRGTAGANTNDLPKANSAGPDLSSLPTGSTLPGGAELKAASGSSLRWTAPGDWTIKAAGSMRKGSYSFGPGGVGDVSITAFPGDVGGPLANVNRWLGQVGLSSIEEGDLSQYTSHMEANGLEFFLADTGSKDALHPQRIMAAVVFWQGNSWFFKMTGPTELVAGAKPAFLEFLRSVKAP